MLTSCRICLQNRAAIPIFENYDNKEYNDVLLKLNLCFGEVPDLPGYPRNICKTCYGLLDETVSFINKFRASCKILDKKIKEAPCDSLDHYSEPEIEFDNASNEIVKVEWPNSQNYLPENLGSNNETPEAKKISNTKTNEHHLPIKKNRNNKIRPCNLKGEYLLQGKKWCLKTTDKLKIIEGSQKEVNISKKVIKNVRKLKRKNVVEDKAKITDRTPQRISVKIQTKHKQPSSQRSPILCEECGKSFTDGYKYTRHKSNHLSEKPHKCTNCAKKFSFLDNLKSHIKRVHNKKTHVCSDCGKVFLCRGSIIKHIQYSHEKIKRKHKGIPCKICGKVNLTLKMALIHERSAHTGERPAVCNVCSARFFHQDYLKEHMRLHTGERPFKCPVCEKGFTQRGNMKSHIKHNHSISKLSEQCRNEIDKKYFKYMKP